ncbi:MAG TPA: MFS transporter [Rhizomicrobium sp.]|jgi:MFS family permease|nr:MFS transporter [Rhizomicrobium sp.]
MAFFRNNTVNLLNLHYGIHALALSGGGAFFAVFLLRAGVPAPAVLASFAAILGGRFLIRPFILPAAKRFGLKPLFIIGTLATGLQYPLLANVHGIGPALYILLCTSSVADTIYWTTYHAYFASLGDKEHRGHQIGAREAIASVIGIVGPLITGWTLTSFGPHIAFGATAVVLMFAAIPIFWTPNVPIPQEAPGLFKSARGSMLIFAADSWSAAGYYFCWQIALFISLGENFAKFGGAMAIAAFVGAVLGLLLGRSIDAGHGKRAVWFAAGTHGANVILRAASFGHPLFAVIANATGALVTAFYVPTMMTAVYNEAKNSPCVMRFHIATEASWDAGGASACLVAAALLWAGASLSYGILLALGGTISMFILLRRYYSENEQQVSAVLPVFDAPIYEVEEKL